MTSIPFWRPRTTDMVNWPDRPVRVPVGPGGCPPGTFPASDRYGPICAGIGIGPQIVYTEANAQLQPGPTPLGPEAMWRARNPVHPRVNPRWQRATVRAVAPPYRPRGKREIEAFCSVICIGAAEDAKACYDHCVDWITSKKNESQPAEPGRRLHLGPSLNQGVLAAGRPSRGGRPGRTNPFRRR